MEKRQTLKKEDGKYTFQITNPGEYEVSVTAADLAGNEAEENISFESFQRRRYWKRRQRQFKKYYLERQKRSRKIGKEKKKTVILPC